MIPLRVQIAIRAVELVTCIHIMANTWRHW